MAENKKSFLFYVDWKDIFLALSKEQRGDLITYLLEYVSDENPDDLVDPVLKMAVIPIKAQLKRDLKKWIGFVEKQSLNGKLGGRPKTQKTQAFFKKPKKAVTVTVTDTVKDTVTDKDKVKDILNIPFSGIEFLKNWELLLTQPKWKKKTQSALQASLNKLGRFDEATATQMIENTIAGGWQGIFEIKANKIKPLETKGKIETMLTNYQIAQGL